MTCQKGIKMDKIRIRRIKQYQKLSYKALESLTINQKHLEDVLCKELGLGEEFSVEHQNGDGFVLCDDLGNNYSISMILTALDLGQIINLEDFGI